MNKIKGTFRINKNMNLNSTQNNKRKYGKSFRFEENFHFIIVSLNQSTHIFLEVYVLYFQRPARGSVSFVTEKPKSLRF